MIHRHGRVNRRLAQSEYPQRQKSLQAPTAQKGCILVLSGVIGGE
jgi:hypothetical protein